MGFRPRMGLCFCHFFGAVNGGVVYKVLFPSPHGALFLSFYPTVVLICHLLTGFRPRMGLCFCH